MRKQISHKALHGLLALAFLITMVFGAFQFFGKLQATQAAEISITEYPIPTRDGEPYGITAGSDGNLWFAEGYGNKIERITPSGIITEYPLPNYGRYSSGITAGPDGNLWFTESNGMNKIGRITPNGVITEYPLPNYGDPNGITAGPDGNLWFTEYGGDKIGRITPNGVITEYPLPSYGNAPNGITAGPDGNLWFTELLGNKIGRVNLAGTTPPSGKWLMPAQGFNVQEGNTITLSVQADPGGTPIVDVTISAAWSGSSRTICDLKKSDNNTTDHYSCKWNFVVGGRYIPAGSVTFNVTITDQNGNLISDPGGSRTGTFKRYHPQISGLTSNYWGGYYDYGGNNPLGGNTLYSDVRATWKVPALPGCGASENSQSATWVGLGGVDMDILGLSHLEQIGTDSDCVNSTKTFCQKDIPCYYAWWETLSPDSGPNGIAFVNPGDTIVAHVQYKGNGRYHLSISDNGKVLFSKDEQGSSDTSARNAADWIVEDPPGVTLANYGTVTFTGCSVDGKPITYGPTLVYTLLSSQQSNQLESVSGLNGIDNSFFVKWIQSQ